MWKVGVWEAGLSETRRLWLQVISIKAGFLEAKEIGLYWSQNFDSVFVFLYYAVSLFMRKNDKLCWNQ